MGGRERVMWWILIMNVRWSTVRFFDLDTPVRRTNDIFYLNVSEDLDEVWAAGGVPRCFNSTPIIARLSTIVYLIHASENYITRGVLRFSSRSFYINLSRGWAVHRFSFCFSFSFFFKKKGNSIIRGYLWGPLPHVFYNGRHISVSVYQEFYDFYLTRTRENKLFLQATITSLFELCKKKKEGALNS